MDGLLRFLACFVVISTPLLVCGKRDLEAEFDALVSQFDEMKVSYIEEITKLQQDNEALRRMHKHLREDHEELKLDHENLRRNFYKLKRGQDDIMQNNVKLNRNYKEDILELRENFNSSLQTIKEQYENSATMAMVSQSSNENIRGMNHYHDDKMVNKKPGSKVLNPKTRNIGDHTEQAAFYAYLSHDITNIGTNQIVVFDKVITNIGHLYNGITGVFTCDLSGTYVFNVHLLAEPGHTVYFVLMQNTNQVSFIYAASADGTYSHGGNTAILQLQAGDVVTVREHDHRSSSGDAVDLMWTSFSGFLLYPGDIEPTIVG